MEAMCHFAAAQPLGGPWRGSCTRGQSHSPTAITRQHPGQLGVGPLLVKGALSGVQQHRSLEHPAPPECSGHMVTCHCCHQ